MKFFTLFVFSCFIPLVASRAENTVVTFDAEDFVEQTANEVRSWHITKADSIPEVLPDADPPHLDGAAGGAYIEVLPDSRRNHGEKLIRGENFSPEPGQMAILKYRVKFPGAGKYYVWARAFSTGSEDNGFHIGLNGKWPESGRRWQTVLKNRWHWECKQRTEKVHTGVPMALYLEIPEAGEQDIYISMREDGCELDQIMLATDPEWRPPGYRREAKGDMTEKGPPVKIDRQPYGDGSVQITGELKTWHKVTLTLDGPWAHELDRERNPFTEYKCEVSFRHESGEPWYIVPAYFAADGNAAESSAVSGTKWRAHLSPDKEGQWDYTVKCQYAGEGPVPGDGATGSFSISASDKKLPDFRARGRLQYVGERYLKFAGDGSRFLKIGADAPETFLACSQFDGTRANNPGKGPLKAFKPHLADWQKGDPTWQSGEGKGIIGAVNYLSSKGLNTFSFLTYNAGGDGDNVWPFVSREEKLHYDVSKLDQWGIVFDHATSKGMHLHFKMQETEMDDNRRGHKTPENVSVPTSLDGGKLGPERKLYIRELIARYAHNLALNWNIGEENTQSPEEIRAMAEYIKEVDPYDHPIVIHTFPSQQDKVYPPLLGEQSVLTGASLQNPWDAAHQRTLKWIRESEAAGKKWVVANDEQNPADLGVPPDPGYAGHSGWAEKEGKKYNLHDIRRDTLWGNLMAGGGGVEYYFGYRLPENDLKMEDFRSRDKSWEFCRLAVGIFHQSGVPFWDMKSADELVGNPDSNNGMPWCLAKKGEAWLIYVPEGKGEVTLDLSGVKGSFSVTKFDPTGEAEAIDMDDIKGGAPQLLQVESEAVLAVKRLGE
ncbi:MAG: DUF5060 domain-containing protein [Verrucomicrobiales bacterium]|nr:DUF5060 domain-containing protein [Verrucomicrobiales bacterium]